MDIIYAVVLTLFVNGAEANYPITYTNTVEECKERTNRIVYILQQIKPSATNIIRAKCVEIHVAGEPNTSA